MTISEATDPSAESQPVRIVLTTTWNSADHVGVFLSHYRKLGFDRVVVMDFDSTDGTREILADPRWQGFVSLFPFPGLERLDSSNLLLAHAKEAFPPDTLGLFCDPDELLVLPGMDARAALPADLGGEGVSAWTFRRSNMTCRRSAAVARPDGMHALGNLVYRASGKLRKNPVGLIGADRLEPAWIFSRLHDKVLVRLSDTAAINSGDHSADTRHPAARAPGGCHILHYPFRSLQAFERKIAMAREDFAANPHLLPGNGWQIRRWIRLEEEGLLEREYLEQFPDDGDFDRYLEEGSLREDARVARFHGSAGVPGRSAPGGQRNA